MPCWRRTSSPCEDAVGGERRGERVAQRRDVGAGEAAGLGRRAHGPESVTCAAGGPRRLRRGRRPSVASAHGLARGRDDARAAGGAAPQLEQLLADDRLPDASAVAAATRGGLGGTSGRTSGRTSGLLGPGCRPGIPRSRGRTRRAVRRLARQDGSMLAGRRNVRITHPDKALFPDGTTKADLAEYYRDVAPVMLPHVRERPVSMQRFNGGIGGPGFFQKDIPKGAPEWVPTVERARRRAGPCTTCSPTRPPRSSGSRTRTASRRTSSPRAPTASTARTGSSGTSTRPARTSSRSCGGPRSRSARSCARRAASRSRCHRLARHPRGRPDPPPLRSFDAVRDAALAVADALAEQHPDELTTAFRKEKRGGPAVPRRQPQRARADRRAGVRGAPRPGAPVATPLHWPEVEDDALRPDRWTLATVRDRLDAEGDPWADLPRGRGALPRLG